MRMRTALLAAILAGLTTAQLAVAQYPTKPIKVLVSGAPGAAPDTITRVVGERLGPQLGQAIVVETRAGSNGNIAMEAASKSAPDGYTLVFCTDSMIVINPHMYAKMGLAA